MNCCDRSFPRLVALAISYLFCLAGCGGSTAPQQPAAPQPNPAPSAAPTGLGVAGGSADATAPAVAVRGGAASNPSGAAVQRGAAWTGDDQQALQLIAESVTLKNNLKLILLGLHNHHDVFQSFLPSLDNRQAYDEQQLPRFSWRVAILPYIDLAPLYNQYNFDEPWDSEQNKAVLNQMPDVFRTPGETGSNTRMQMIVGEGTAVEPGKRDARISDMIDGTSNTLLVAHVGADKAVPWTKPDDMPFDPLAVRNMFGNIGDSLLFATADGMVHKIPADAPESDLRNLITRNDGNPIDLASLEQPDAPLPWMSAPPRSGPLTTAYMPDDCFGVVVLHPRRAMNSDLFKQLMPPELLGQAAAGAPVDPQGIEEAVLWLAPPDPTGDVTGKVGGAAIRFTEPFEYPPQGDGGGDGPGAALLPPGAAMPPGAGFGGPRLPVPPEQVYRHDDRTLVFGSQFRLHKLLSGKQPPAALAERVAKADGDLIILVDTSDGQLIQRVGQAIPQDDPNAQAAMFGVALFLSPFANSNLVEINLDLSGQNLLALRSECKSPQDAQKFQQAIQGFAQMGRQNEQTPAEAGAVLDQLQYSAEGATGIVALPRNEVVTRALTDAVAMALQAAQNARQNSGLGNNLKMIGLAYHNMYDVNQGPRPWSVPTDLGPDGKPYLSWRVHSLPFLDENELYGQFHLDEPWDSDHNKALLDRMPDAYRFSEGSDPTTTQAVYLTGPQTLFDGKINGRFENITDGTSNTILCLIVPTEKAVPWTQPVDAVFDPDDPLAVVRPISPDGIRVLFADGHVDTLPADIDADTFKALVTPAGGEPVSLE